MFAELLNLFGNDNKKEDENEVIRNKFKRIGRHTATAMPAVRHADPVIQIAPSHQRLVAHWTESAQADIEQNRFYEAEPHMKQLMNNASTLLEPGSAEVFQSCKPHPLDELNARRKKEEAVDNTRRFFAYSKRVKSA